MTENVRACTAAKHAIPLRLQSIDLMCTLRKSGAISRKLIIGISIPVILVTLAISWWLFARYQQQRARADWKNMAIARLAGLSLTDSNIVAELETLKASRSAGGRQDWTGESVLVMTNGEFLVYASRHGSESWFVDHLFLAHGSDERWYYSTYHFCNRMAMLMSDDPPGSIAEFAARYAAREFDGKSDTCLQHTWP